MMQQNFSMRQHPPKKTLGEVSTNTNISSTTDLNYRRINPDYWIKAYRKDINTFKVYLDGFDDKNTNSLRRKIKLLGGSHEVFLGQQCTHIATAKPFYEEQQTKDLGDALTPKDTNQENKPSQVISKNTLPKKPCVAKDPSHQAFFDRAHMWGIEVWTMSKMTCVINALFNKSTVHAPPTSRSTRLENLDKMLLEEKRYGVNTGQRSGKAPRPTFVTFNDRYVMVEDVTGVHCPILVKEYTMPTFDPAIPENDKVYPWPKLYVKEDAHSRSPFVLPDPKQQSSKKAGTQQSQQLQQQIPLQPNNHAFATPLTATFNHNNININATQTTTGIPLNKLLYDSTKNQRPFTPQIEKENIDPNLNQEQPRTTYLDTVGQVYADLVQNSSRTSYTTTTAATSVFPSITSNFSQQSKSTNTHLTNSTVLNTSDKTSIAFRRSGPPLSENMSRMGRRMVSNQRISHLAEYTNTTGTENAPTKKSPGKDTNASQSKGLRSAVLAKTAHDQVERRKKDLARRMAKENSKYCENCGTCYQDLEKHQQDESHQAFVRDKNNFKELDLVLESTQRTGL